MKRRMFVGFISAAVATFAFAAHAVDRDFTVVNNTGETIVSLYASPTSQTTWGSDLLGSDTLANGASVLLHYTPSMYRGQCVFDIKIVDSDNGQHVVNAINLCTITTVTFSTVNGEVVFRAQ
jgi:hypothetical protein